MLTEIEQARLEGWENEDQKEKVTPAHRRYNNMIVRDKIRQWMEDTKDVLFAIDKLPKKQVRTLATDELIYNLLTIALCFLDASDFAQIQGNSIEDAMAVRAIKNIEDGQWEKWARKAEERDFERNHNLFWILSILANYTSYLNISPALNEYILKKIEGAKSEDSNKEPLFAVMLPQKRESELYRMRHAGFSTVRPQGQGSRQYDMALIQVLQDGKTLDISEILVSLGVDPNNLAVTDLIWKQLMSLEEYGLIQETKSGWKWSK
jgi:hypothetical protein